MDITIYHNPKCGTSRNTLALIRNTGIEPQVIEYVKNPPTREVLKGIIARARLTVRGAIREKGTLIVRDRSDYLTSRYSERKQATPELATMLAAAAMSHEAALDETKDALE